MNGDESQSTPTPAPSGQAIIKGEKQVSGGVIHDQEVRDYVTEVENPAVEVAPQVEISQNPVESPIDAQAAPSVPIAPTPTVQAPEPTEALNNKILGLPASVEVLKGINATTDPTANIGIGTITVRQDTRTRSMKAQQQVQALPKAA